MLRWSQGKTRKDTIENETIRGIATRSTLIMTVMGTRPRGRPKMRWLDRLKSDMRIYGINP